MRTGRARRWHLGRAARAAGTVFVALGYVSTAAETALVHVAAAGDLTATEAAAYWCTVRGMPYHTVSWY